MSVNYMYEETKGGGDQLLLKGGLDLNAGGRSLPLNAFAVHVRLTE